MINEEKSIDIKNCDGELRLKLVLSKFALWLKLYKSSYSCLYFINKISFYIISFAMGTNLLPKYSL